MAWLLIAAASSVGCAISSKAALTESRLSTTGVLPGDRVAVVVNELTSCPQRGQGTCWRGSKSSGRERQLVRQMIRLMRSSSRGLQLISPEEFRLALFQEQAIVDSPITSEAVFRILSAAGSAARLDALGARYLVIIDAQQTRVPTGTEWDVVEGAWGFARKWRKTATLHAEILDLKRASRCGALESISSGSSGFGMMFLLFVIPLPPIGWSSMPERKASKALGLAIADFLAVSDSFETPLLPPDQGEEPQPQRLQPHQRKEADLVEAISKGRSARPPPLLQAEFER